MLNRQTYSSASSVSDGYGRESSWYHESCICNYLSEPILISRADGSIDEIPPVFDRSKPYERVLMVHSSSKGGTHRTSGYTPGGVGTYRDIHTVEIPKADLGSGPVVVPEMGITIALTYHRSLIEEANHLDPKWSNRRLEQATRASLSEGYGTPFYLIINSHYENIDRMHVVINNRVYTVGILHDTKMDPTFSISVRRSNAVSIFTYPEVDLLNSEARTINVGGDEWIIGTNFEKVQKMLNKRLSEEQAKYTKAELEFEVMTATNAAKREVEVANRTIDNLKQELQLLKAELANTKLELSKAHDSAKASLEQQVLANKLATAMAEAEYIKEQNTYKREQFVRDKIRDDWKTETELISARSKIMKEYASNITTFVKFALVVAPLVVSAYKFFTKRTSSG